jgi:hypothetical protein
MAASKQTIERWFTIGKKFPTNTHMIVVCDTYDWEDYPVYVRSNQDVKQIEAEYAGKNMQKVMEVYNLSMDMHLQLNQHRTFNY